MPYVAPSDWITNASSRDVTIPAKAGQDLICPVLKSPQRQLEGQTHLGARFLTYLLVLIVPTT
jgi:hypothetical protein